MRVSLPAKALLWDLASIGAWAGVKATLAQRRKLDFRGKVVLITGGSRGLGLELARLLAREGASLVLCARDADELTRAKNELLRSGVSVYTQVCDVTDKNQVEQLAENVRQTLGPVDVLINNAGTIIVTPFEHATEGDFLLAMDTHFWASFHLINAVLPQTVSGASLAPGQAGRIVNITSIGGKVAVPHLHESTHSA